MNTIDLIGKRFGRLVVVGKLPERRRKHIVWKCKCDCGETSEVLGYNLRYGKTKSCGCLEQENKARILGNHIKHNYRNDPVLKYIYNVWKSMRSRCFRKTDSRYSRYGGRGITICQEWNDPVVFVNWALANGYCRGLQIDRIDNDGNYCPDNCRFIPIKENNRNSSNTHLNRSEVDSICKEYACGNVKQSDLAVKYGVTQQTISKIINKKSWN